MRLANHTTANVPAETQLGRSFASMASDVGGNFAIIEQPQ